MSLFFSVLVARWVHPYTRPCLLACKERYFNDFFESLSLMATVASKWPTPLLRSLRKKQQATPKL